MFDPAQPADHSPLDSAVMRSQLTSLKSLIDAVLGVTAAQVDGVSTLNPGDPATAAVTLAGTTLHFTFAIPQGNAGAQGDPGPQGPPFAQALVDAVNTLNPGDSATVSVSFDGTNVHFTFGIPRGAEGVQGPPGEVTNAQLTSAIATTAQNPSGVAPLSQSADSNYNQGQMQQVMDKLDEVLNAIKRV